MKHLHSSMDRLKDSKHKNQTHCETNLHSSMDRLKGNI